MDYLLVYLLTSFTFIFDPDVTSLETDVFLMPNMSQVVLRSILFVCFCFCLCFYFIRLLQVTPDLPEVALGYTGSEDREALGVGSIAVAILPSCQDIKTIASLCIQINIVG